MVFVFLFLTSLSMIISRSIHVASNGIISFFLWLSNISLCVSVCVCVCVCMPHLLYPFICQWTFRLLPYLAIINSAAMNIGVHISFQIIVLSGYMPRSSIAGSHGNSVFFSFLRNLLISIVAAPIYIHTNSEGRFPSLYILSSMLFVNFL